jgi:hypothetical protein
VASGYRLRADHCGWSRSYPGEIVVLDILLEAVQPPLKLLELPRLGAPEAREVRLQAGELPAQLTPLLVRGARRASQRLVGPARQPSHERAERRGVGQVVALVLVHVAVSIEGEWLSIGLWGVAVAEAEK